MSTLEDISENIQSLSILVSKLHTQNDSTNHPMGDISEFIKNSERVSGKSEQMIQNMIANLGEKYAKLKRETKKKDDIIQSMEKVILNLNGGKFPEEIEENVNHYEEELVKQREETKQHYTEKKLHQHAVELLECHHYEKNKLIDYHEAKMVEHKERLINTHLVFTEETDAKARQIYELEKQIDELKKQPNDNNLGYQKHITNNVNRAVEDVIDHYEELLDRVSKENLDKHLESKKLSGIIDKHNADHNHKDKTIADNTDHFEDHSQNLKETIMHLQMELQNRDGIIDQLKQKSNLMNKDKIEDKMMKANVKGVKTPEFEENVYVVRRNKKDEVLEVKEIDVIKKNVAVVKDVKLQKYVKKKEKDKVRVKKKKKKKTKQKVVPIKTICKYCKEIIIGEVFHSENTNKFNLCEHCHQYVEERHSQSINDILSSEDTKPNTNFKRSGF